MDEARLDDARRRIARLRLDLERLVDRDPDQEVWERAIPVLDAVLAVVRQALPGDPVIAAVEDFMSAAAVVDGRELRAAEALLIVGQIDAAIPPVSPAMPSWSRIPDDENPMKMRF